MIFTLPVVVISELFAVNVTVPDIVKSTQVRFLEVPSEVLNVPPDSRKLPAHVRSCVRMLMEPPVTVRLYIETLALIVFDVPDIDIVVELLWVNVPDIVILPVVVIVLVSDAVNVPFWVLLVIVKSTHMIEPVETVIVPCEDAPPLIAIS